MHSSHSRVEFDFDKFFHATVQTAAVRIVQVGPIQPAAHANNEKVRHLLVEHVRPRGQDGSCGEEIVVMRNNSLMQKGILPAFLEAHEKGASEFTFRLTGLPGSLRTVETFEISKARPAAQPTLVVNNTTPPKQTSEPVIITYAKRYNSQGTDTFCLYVPAETYAGAMFAGKGFYRFSESPDGQLFFAPTDKQSELKFESSKVLADGTRKIYFRGLRVRILEAKGLVDLKKYIVRASRDGFTVQLASDGAIDFAMSAAA
jgi:hypothetical protein